MSAELSSELKNYYDSFYDDHEGEWRWIGSVDKYNNIVSMCKERPHARVLEVGAGEGSILQRLAEAHFGSELYALEISKSGVNAIRARDIGSLVDAKLYDGYNIPYGAHEFDLCILSHVIEHVEYPRQLIYEAARVARNVFIEVPLEDNVRLPRDFEMKKVGHINFYNAKSARRLIQSCGLRVDKELISTPCTQTYVYRYGKSGRYKRGIKVGLLKAAPWLALRLFTYHASYLCSSE